MFRKQFYFLGFLLLTYIPSVWARDAVRLLQKDGEMLTCMLSKQPIVTYESDKLVLKSENIQFESNLSDLLRFEFFDAETNTDIQQLSDTEKTSFTRQGGSLLLEGTQPGVTIAIYNLSGQIVSQFKSSSNGTLVIPLSDLPNGTLVIRTPKLTYKLIK